jgi:hypothetical protein
VGISKISVSGRLFSRHPYYRDYHEVVSIPADELSVPELLKLEVLLIKGVGPRVNNRGVDDRQPEERPWRNTEDGFWEVLEEARGILGENKKR